MEPRERLPEWVYMVSPVVLVLLIVIGGLWIRSMEIKAREKERAGEPTPE